MIAQTARKRERSLDFTPPRTAKAEKQGDLSPFSRQLESKLQTATAISEELCAKTRELESALEEAAARFERLREGCDLPPPAPRAGLREPESPGQIADSDAKPRRERSFFATLQSVAGRAAAVGLPRLSAAQAKLAQQLALGTSLAVLTPDPVEPLQAALLFAALQERRTMLLCDAPERLRRARELAAQLNLHLTESPTEANTESRSDPLLVIADRSLGPDEMYGLRRLIADGAQLVACAADRVALKRLATYLSDAGVKSLDFYPVGYPSTSESDKRITVINEEDLPKVIRSLRDRLDDLRSLKIASQQNFPLAAFRVREKSLREAVTEGFDALTKFGKNDTCEIAIFDSLRENSFDSREMFTDFLFSKADLCKTLDRCKGPLTLILSQFHLSAHRAKLISMLFTESMLTFADNSLVFRNDKEPAIEIFASFALSQIPQTTVVSKSMKEAIVTGRNLADVKNKLKVFPLFSLEQSKNELIITFEEKDSVPIESELHLMKKEGLVIQFSLKAFKSVKLQFSPDDFKYFLSQKSRWVAQLNSQTFEDLHKFDFECAELKSLSVSFSRVTKKERSSPQVLYKVYSSGTVVKPEHKSFKKAEILLDFISILKANFETLSKKLSDKKQKNASEVLSEFLLEILISVVCQKTTFEVPQVLRAKIIRADAEKLWEVMQANTSYFLKELNN